MEIEQPSEPTFLETGMAPLNVSKAAVKARIVTTVILHEQHAKNEGPYARCEVRLFSDDGDPVATQHVAFTEEELSAWGDDDAVLLNLALAKLG